ncbi:unnamed protein product [Pylaiella littoralis]
MATAAITPGERPVGHGECEFLSPRENNGEQRGLRSSPRAGSESSGSGTGVNKTPSNFMERVQARVRSDAATADYRADIVRSIFGEVGTPVEDFSCAVESRILLHGRMYVTNTFVCFYSNLFGFEKIIKIPFCHMRCITKEKTALFIPNAIAIITSKKEYIFRSFWDREDAFQTLKQCKQDADSSVHSASLAEGPPPLEAAPPPDLSSARDHEEHEQSQNWRHNHSRSTSTSTGSRSSDKETDDKGATNRPRRRMPWSGKGNRKRLSSSAVAGDLADASTYSGWFRPRNGGHGLSVSAPSSNDASFSSLHLGGGGVGIDLDIPGGVTVELPPPSPDDRVGEQTAEGGGKEGDGVAAAAAAALEGSGVAGGGGEGGSTLSDGCFDSEVDVLGVEGSPVIAVSLGATTGGGKLSSKAEEFKAALAAFGEGWLIGDGGGGGGGGEKERPPERTPNKGATVRIATEIPCQLQEFFKLFVSNDAEKGIPAFHESLGDSDVQATPWKVAGGALGMTREIRFVHPISAPIGPNRTRAVKLQRCRLYDEHGLVLETSTHLEDIVMSDYFQIDDRCVVQPGQKGAVRVDVEVEIKFFKSTMFRKTIETKSLSETRQVWESFIAMAKDAIQKRTPVLPLRTPSDDDDEGNSDDEGRIKATRERLRERRKHRNRTRHHPQPQPHTPRSLSHDRGGPEAPLPSRPRAKSAASMVPLRPHSVPEDSLPGKRGIGGAGLERKRGKSAAGVVERKRGNAGSAGGGAADAEWNAKGLSSGGGSVLVTPVPSLTGWLFSFAAVPWYLLAIVFLVEALEYSRFSSETAGFLEAAEAALTVLGAGIDGQGGGGGTERGGAAAAVSGTTVVLKEELARGLMRIYSRNRFLWPFSSFVQ